MYRPSDRVYKLVKVVLFFDQPLQNSCKLFFAWVIIISATMQVFILSCLVPYICIAHVQENWGTTFDPVSSCPVCLSTFHAHLGHRPICLSFVEAVLQVKRSHCCKNFKLFTALLLRCASTEYFNYIAAEQL